ncbi:SAG family member [Eimeria brunetti]|uniref:SAG family member n=1 Tax=Eimeria brunetti TaxID=51314 RepID=U6L682_9EIME|nr:SAG family member [Eimeria brunetti]
MPSLRLLKAVSASFLLLAKSSATETITYKVELGSGEVCLSEINTARVNAGFKEFKAAQNSAETSEKGEAEETRKALENFVSGTYAFKNVEGGKPNCTEVVNVWKAAYTNFNGTPPPKGKNESLYRVPENVSFVAMYNPSADATASCRVVTCTKTVSNGPTRSAEVRGQTSRTDGTTTGSALMCLTTPDILFTNAEIAPFTEDQWAQIVTAFEGSASTALPTLLGLAAAFVSVVAIV